jgi:hypothetical protein
MINFNNFCDSDFEEKFLEHYNSNLKQDGDKLQAGRALSLEKFYVRVWTLIALILLITLFFIIGSRYCDLSRQVNARTHLKMASATIYLKCDNSQIFSFTIKRDAYFQTLMTAILISLIAAISQFIYSPIKKFNSAIKRNIYPKIFKIFGDDIQYSEKSSFDLQEFEKFLIVPKPDNCIVEDCVNGKYKDYYFESFQAELTDDGGRGGKIKVFKGMFIVIDLRKNLESRIIIDIDRGYFGNLFRKITNQKKFGLENVKFNNLEFEKRFEVYADDANKAMSALSGKAIHGVGKISEIYNNKKITFSFVDQNVLIMIPTNKNHFEFYSIFKKPDLYRDSRMIVEEINVIFDVIDKLL